jgi:hypothetical protein
MAKVTVKLDTAKIAHLEKIQEQALWQAAEAVHTDIVQAQVMPFDTGNLQNESTSVQKIDPTHVQIQTVAPYAKRLYYHPEYNFRKNNNPDARGRWLEPWINGGKKNFFSQAFSRFFKSLI